MNRRRIVGALLTSLGCLAALGVPAALAATNNPIWKTSGANLAAGKKEPLEASAHGAQLLTSTNLWIMCNKLALNNGDLVGVSLPGPGQATGTLEYKECSVTGPGTPTCKINGAALGQGIITTTLLAGHEAYLTKIAAETEALSTEETVTVLKPSAGEAFATFELTGTCPITGVVKLEGSGVVIKNLGNDLEMETRELEAPTLAITKYFENISASTKEVKGIKLEVAGSACTYSGKAIAKLASKNKWNLAL